VALCSITVVTTITSCPQ